MRERSRKLWEDVALGKVSAQLLGQMESRVRNGIQTPARQKIATLLTNMNELLDLHARQLKLIEEMLDAVDWRNESIRRIKYDLLRQPTEETLKNCALRLAAILNPKKKAQPETPSGEPQGASEAKPIISHQEISESLRTKLRFMLAHVQDWTPEQYGDWVNGMTREEFVEFVGLPIDRFREVL